MTDTLHTREEEDAIRAVIQDVLSSEELSLPVYRPRDQVRTTLFTLCDEVAASLSCSVLVDQARLAEVLARRMPRNSVSFRAVMAEITDQLGSTLQRTVIHICTYAMATPSEMFAPDAVAAAHATLAGQAVETV